MITPTNGRIVWFTPAHYDTHLTYNDQPLAAIVTHVHSDSMVNLAVFDANGRCFPFTSVLLLQDDAKAPYDRYCQWMPYQKQVASGQIAPNLHADPKAKQ